MEEPRMRTDDPEAYTSAEAQARHQVQPTSAAERPPSSPRTLWLDVHWDGAADEPLGPPRALWHGVREGEAEGLPHSPQTLRPGVREETAVGPPGSPRVLGLRVREETEPDSPGGVGVALALGGGGCPTSGNTLRGGGELSNCSLRSLKPGAGVKSSLTERLLAGACGLLQPAASSSGHPLEGLARVLPRTITESGSSWIL